MPRLGKERASELLLVNLEGISPLLPYGETGEAQIARKITKRIAREDEGAPGDRAQDLQEQVSKACKDCGTPTPPPPDVGEVSAVAELLGVTMDTLSSLKLPGPLEPLPESILTTVPGMLPDLGGFDAPEQFALWHASARMERDVAFAAQYRSPQGAIVIVSHESGPEVFLLALEGAAAAATVLSAAYTFLRLVGSRADRDPSKSTGLTVTRRWYDASGNVRHEEIVELTPADDSSGRSP